MAQLNDTAASPAGPRPYLSSVGGSPAGDGYWPQHALQAFTLRMAGHGLCVSSSLMIGDRHYALEQLALAHTLADAELRGIAVDLFAHFERQRRGLPYAN